MKLKQIPEDFVVREATKVQLNDHGEFAVYTLHKRGIGTIEAVNLVARAFKVDRQDVAFGGLKDKWAVTEQAISIRNGPRKNLMQETFRLEFVGMSTEPIRRGSFDRNGFRITLRDLSESDLTHLRRALGEIEKHGLPNFFDSQRFGSVKDGIDYIAKRLIAGDFEGALQLAIATPNRDDRSKVRKVKQLLKDHWGNWKDCLGLIPRRNFERRIVNTLSKNPADFAHAFELIDRNLRLLYVSAYQSYLWNRCLTLTLEKYVDPTQLFRKRYEVGELLFYHVLPSEHREQLTSLEIPLASHAAPADETLAQALREENLEPRQLKLKGLNSTYFSKGRRRAIIFPEGLESMPVEPDELNAGRSKAVLDFTLPRGSYATILVKRIFH